MPEEHLFHLLKALLPDDEDDAAVLILQLCAAGPRHKLPLITANAFSQKGLARLEECHHTLLDLADQVQARWRKGLALPVEKRTPALKILDEAITAALKPKPKAKTKEAA